MRWLVLIAFCGCFRDGPTRIVEVPGPIQHIKVPTPCLTSPPPALGSVDCMTLTVEDCIELTKAVWLDYGRKLDAWVHLYAWPMCESH